MEPLSIATACVGTLSTFSKLSLQIAIFVASLKNARKDMEAVSCELSSLSSCLAALRDDSERVSFPTSLRETVISCDHVAKEISSALGKLQSSSIARIRWTFSVRDHINKLRSSLESHKTCIDIALGMASS